MKQEMIAILDLFIFDEEDDRIHDLISNTIFTLDELKDVNGVIEADDARQLLNRFIN